MTSYLTVSLVLTLAASRHHLELPLRTSYHLLTFGNPVTEPATTKPPPPNIPSLNLNKMPIASAGSPPPVKIKQEPQAAPAQAPEDYALIRQQLSDGRTLRTAATPSVQNSPASSSATATAPAAAAPGIPDVDSRVPAAGVPDAAPQEPAPVRALRRGTMQQPIVQENPLNLPAHGPAPVLQFTDLSNEYKRLELARSLQIDANIHSLRYLTLTPEGRRAVGWTVGVPHRSHEQRFYFEPKDAGEVSTKISGILRHGHHHTQDYLACDGAMSGPDFWRTLRYLFDNDRIHTKGQNRPYPMAPG